VRAEARALVFGGTAEHPALARHPSLAGWVEGLAARGRLSHLAPEAGRELLREVLDVLERLPAAGEPLPVLAGDAWATRTRSTAARDSRASSRARCR
jgi:hypothetical protein